MFSSHDYMKSENRGTLAQNLIIVDCRQTVSLAAKPLTYLPLAGKGKNYRKLKSHVEQTHFQAMALPSSCLADLMAYYTGAIAQKERESMPIIGPSVDRRTFKLLRQVYNNSAVGGRALNFLFLYRMDLSVASCASICDRKEISN